MKKGFREKSAQYRAVSKSRRAMLARGLGRYEVRGLESDKVLVRDLAKKLAVNDAGSQELRNELLKRLAPGKSERGGVWRWLRSSPLVGVDWYTERPFDPGRKIDL